MSTLPRKLDVPTRVSARSERRDADRLDDELRLESDVAEWAADELPPLEPRCPDGDDLLPLEGREPADTHAVVEIEFGGAMSVQWTRASDCTPEARAEAEERVLRALLSDRATARRSRL